MPLFEIARDLIDDAELLRRRRYGVIEMHAARLSRVLLRPWPKLPTWWEAQTLGKWRHRSHSGDGCRLYYNQPRGGNFLSLAYIESSRDGTLAGFHGAVEVLDEIARLKRSDFIVTDVANARISDRLLARWGWSPLPSRRWHRLFVKRFYGDYSCAKVCASGAIVTNGKEQVSATLCRSCL